MDRSPADADELVDASLRSQHLASTLAGGAHSLSPTSASPEAFLNSAWAGEPQEPVRYGFVCGGDGFLLKVGTPCEVIEAHGICRLPHAPTWLAGLINVRGNLVPVCDLRRLSDREATCTENRAPGAAKEYYLVVDRGERMAAFIAEQLPRALRTGALQRLTTPPQLDEALRAHVGQTLRAGGDTWFDLDHQGLLESLATGLA